MNNYVLVKISGKNVKRFIISLYNKGINFYDIKYNNKSVYIKITYKDYNILSQIKTIYKISIIKYYGLIKIKKYIVKSKIFIFSTLLSLLILYLLSNIIFEIEIINDKKEIRDLVKEELNKYNIKKYKFIKNFHQNEIIKKQILNKNKKIIEWMEIERIGNKYIVKVEERKYNIEDGNKNIQNIVAKKKGILTKIDAKSGEVLRKINDYVLPNDIIISGIIKNKDKIKYIGKAEGKVYAEIWYNIKVEIPIQYKEKKETKLSNTKIKYNILNYKTRSNFKEYKETPIFKLSNLLLPLSIGIYKEKEIEYIELINTPDKAINLALNKSYEKIKRNLGKNDKIIYQKCLKIIEKNSTILIDIFLKTEEDITKTKEIILDELEEEKE